MKQATDTDRISLLRTMLQHREYVAIGLNRFAQEMVDRGLRHDLSKLNLDEFDGFASINRVAREHKYGSEEYRQSMRDGKETIHLHYSRNSHHPEFHEDYRIMGLFDTIEMVIDWWSAWQTYGKSRSWQESIHVQIDRFTKFGREHWWIIGEVAEWLEPEFDCVTYAEKLHEVEEAREAEMACRNAEVGET